MSDNSHAKLMSLVHYLRKLLFTDAVVDFDEIVAVGLCELDHSPRLLRRADVRKAKVCVAIDNEAEK